MKILRKKLNTNLQGGASGASVVDIEDENGETTTTDIREAFVDDDVITEFRKDKKRQVEDDKPKVIDLILPGFDGEWAGEDFKVIFVCIFDLERYFSHQNVKNVDSESNRSKPPERIDRCTMLSYRKRIRILKRCELRSCPILIRMFDRWRKSCHRQKTAKN